MGTPPSIKELHYEIDCEPAKYWRGACIKVIEQQQANGERHVFPLIKEIVIDQNVSIRPFSSSRHRTPLREMYAEHREDVDSFMMNTTHLCMRKQDALFEILAGAASEYLPDEWYIIFYGDKAVGLIQSIVDMDNSPHYEFYRQAPFLISSLRGQGIMHKCYLALKDMVERCYAKKIGFGYTDADNKSMGALFNAAGLVCINPSTSCSVVIDYKDGSVNEFISAFQKDVRLYLSPEHVEAMRIQP